MDDSRQDLEDVPGPGKLVDVTQQLNELLAQVEEGDWSKLSLLTKELETLPEDERFLVIHPLLDDDRPEILGLRLALLCLTKREYFYRILDLGVGRWSVRSVDDWLNSVVHHIGFRRTALALCSMVNSHRTAVALARFPLGFYLPKDNPRAVEALRKLDELLGDEYR